MKGVHRLSLPEKLSEIQCDEKWNEKDQEQKDWTIRSEVTEIHKKSRLSQVFGESINRDGHGQESEHDCEELIKILKMKMFKAGIARPILLQVWEG